jgi:hypothetical protein
MFRSIVILLGCSILLTNANLNGIFVIDSCECDSPNEKCESNGPFIFDQQRSTVAVRYGATQVGVGTLGNNRLDLYLNQNRCKGLWNGKSHLAELKCQHKDGIICSTKLRCVSGSCLDDTTTIINSSATQKTISILVPLISSLFILLY